MFGPTYHCVDDRYYEPTASCAHPQNVTILDLGVKDAVWIAQEGIWLHDLAALDGVLDVLDGIGCLIEVADNRAIMQIAGYTAQIRALASLPDEELLAQGIPRFHQIRVVTMCT